MLITQFQSFYDQICESGQYPDDIREKIITYFLKVFYLHKNADSIYEQKGKVDKRYMKRIDNMIASLEKEKESVLKLVDFKNKVDLDAAINEKIGMIKQVYQEGLKKKEEEEAREKLRAQQEEEERNRVPETPTELPSQAANRELPVRSTPKKNTPGSPSKRATVKIMDPKEAKKFEMDERVNYENQMLNVADQMKAVARSYNETLREDDKILDKINDQSDKNLNKLQKSHKKLDDVLQREQKVGFFRLLIMAAIALALFIATAGLIFLDRMGGNIFVIGVIFFLIMMGITFVRAVFGMFGKFGILGKAL